MSIVLSLYLFLFLFVANLDFAGFNTVNQIILWVISPIVTLLIFHKNNHRIKDIPKEYFFYGSMLIISILGYFISKDVDGFIRYYRVLFTNSILMVIIFLAIRDVYDLRKVLYSIAISCIMVVLFSFYIESPNLNDEYFRMAGLMGNANGTAIIARIGMMIIILIWVLNYHPKNIVLKSVLLISFFLLYLGIIVTASRANFLFASLIFPFIIFNSKKLGVPTKILLGLILSIVVFYFYSEYFTELVIYRRLTDNSGYLVELEEENRFRYMLLALETFFEYPVVGIGLNQFRYISGGKISHTDLLDIAVQLGFLGVLAYGGMYFNLFKRMIRNLKYLTNRLSNINRWLLFFLISEFSFGLFGTNWFFQIHMIFLSVLITITLLIKRNPVQILNQIIADGPSSTR
ncbi:O-antigen ligase family protein [Fulvivirga lutea]|uniref:O-antigen ligase family protein n=1 Tax=Fulvivirga lutea TaxID=2810512 RepID=A0A975A0G8_9BACT|nr:O-antigen ligase family protein [Fulvivirga lutea]QSE96806.1 O-antigen ligase family protein [Fulvivirga lutea]